MQYVQKHDPAEHEHKEENPEDVEIITRGGAWMLYGLYKK